ncbi:MAG: thioredoxin domain-containing protein [Methanotrichaceae archaeon]|nr:thioredoxin domain-containing protein [Methanotrichaceae archaeon]
MIDRPNHLVSEKSPYLKQHAYNPVDWYPWCDQAFRIAERLDKPIFLSIGYSSCHWCHVMSQESFEDLTVAELMNDVFVCIKVDREERPDIDQIYMTVCQLMTRRGGWPLTIILAPDKKPFFAATYLPKRGNFGQIGMIELISRIKDLWINNRKELVSNAEGITNYLKQRQFGIHESGELNESTLDAAYKSLVDEFDLQNGGFGSSPKFPNPHYLLYLLRYWHRKGVANALDMVETTLKALRLGGIYDHIGFGFHRYSTDAQWFVPHFEKMLYDQALLLLVFIEAYQATAKDEYAYTAREILEYVLRDMTSPEGGFYSAEDADSEGEEGKFYLWTMDELKTLLTKEEIGLFFGIFDIRESGNFGKGRNILHMISSLEDASSILGMQIEDLRQDLDKIREKLFKYRSMRTRPVKDDKILADWNGLMIVALARAIQIFDEPKYVDAACKAVSFTLEKMRDPDKRLLHRYREVAGIQANLDDYAFMIWGLIELYEVIFDLRYLRAALDLNRIMLDHFWDKDAGGLFFAPDDGESLIVRQKEIYDGALPSGNSVAIFNMLRLYHITGNSELKEMANVIFRIFAGSITKQPLGHVMFMCALDFALGPISEVAIVGSSKSAETMEMLKALRIKFMPNKVIILVDGDEFYHIAEFTRDLKQLDGRSTAYICINHECKLPTHEPEKILELLREGR